jgi:hydroxyethylthiazole kinase-like uncharacterized protein yjeF
MTKRVERTPNMLLVTAEQSRRIDALTIQEFGTPGHVLMERAGAGATAALLAQFPHLRGGRVVIVAGKGNNGGDGCVMARLLARKGVRAEVALLARTADVGGDARTMLQRLQRTKVPVTEIVGAAAAARLSDRLRGAALVIDAVFGTGLNAPIEGPLADALHAINASGVPVFAVDIPSGLHADTGVPLGVAVQAEATATFGFAKVGQVLYPGVQHVGALAVIDIGLAPEAVARVAPQIALLGPQDVAPLVPLRDPQAHKGTCGHLLVIAGSQGHTGAARLTAHAACRAGAGLTTLAGPKSLNDIFCAGAPEVMTAPLPDENGFLRFEEGEMRTRIEGKTALAIGPGLGTHDDAQRMVEFLLAETALPMVVDADALTCLARVPERLRRSRPRTLLTPHPGEMARLLATTPATVQADRLGVARTFAIEHGCTLVLKGARSVIADAHGRAWINPTGNPGMASGGMGDALSGILGALLAQGLSVDEAARLGVYLHGDIADHIAARRGDIGLLASDVIAGIPDGLRRLVLELEAEVAAIERPTRRRRPAGASPT